MVSHPQPSERALSHRAGSVSSSTRRHRSSRSHSGGTSYRPQNEFPNFAQTGDVEIIIHADGHERRYMLHRLILSQCSGFFEASTSEEWSRAQAPSQGNPLGRIGEDEDHGHSRAGSSMPGSQRERRRWRYELDWGNKDDEVPMLVQRQPESTLFGGSHSPQPPPITTSKPAIPPSSKGFLRTLTNLPAMQSASHIASKTPSSSSTYTTSNHPSDSDTVRDYDNLFRIFYNYPPHLDPLNIAEAYIQCKTLLTLADMYDALEVVGPRIDHHLLQFQSRLWKQIAKYPPSYLKLGYLARSKVIFAEALVHVVGQWPSGSGQLRHTVPEAVLDVIEDKVEEMEERRMRAEARLFRISLTGSRGDRVNPVTNPGTYIDFVSLSLFRHWLVENSPPPLPAPSSSSSKTPSGAAAPHKPPLSQGPFYRHLSSTTNTYLTHDEVKKFVRVSARSEDSSREMVKKVERRLEEIKAQAREVVRPLMRHCLELDVGGGGGGGGLGYLTCTKVEDGDFPWD